MSNYKPTKHHMFYHFYLIPGFNKYVITKTGVVMQIAKTRTRNIGDIVNQNKKKTCSIPKVSILPNDSFISVPVTIFRLLCLAFHGPCPENKVAGCIDGNLENLSYTNVNWIERTYRKGVKRPHQNKKCYCFDLKENKEYKFDSVIEAAEFFKISSNAISLAIARNAPIDKNIFITFDKDVNWTEKIKSINYWFCYEIKTGTVTRFTCRKDIAKYLGVSAATITAAVYHGKNKCIRDKYLISTNPNQKWELLLSKLPRMLLKDNRFNPRVYLTNQLFEQGD